MEPRGVPPRGSRHGEAEAAEKGSMQEVLSATSAPFKSCESSAPTPTKWKTSHPAVRPPDGECYTHVSQMNRYFTKQGTETESSSQSSQAESDSSLPHSSAQSLDEDPSSLDEVSLSDGHSS